MSDWQPGDLALCIKSNWRVAVDNGHDDRGFRPRRGGIYQVHQVFVGGGWLSTWPPGVVGLVFRDAPMCGFNASGFRKIRPHAPDEEDEITIRLLTGEPARIADDELARASAYPGRG